MTPLAADGQVMGAGAQFFNHEPGDEELADALYRLRREAPTVHTYVSRLVPIGLGIDPDNS